MKFGASKNPKNSSKKELSPASRQLAVSLVINSLLVMFVYYGALALNIPIIAHLVTVAYMVIFGAFLVAYIAYNRAFSRKDVTADMLPDDWTDEQKQNYINDGKIRAEKSRWMLSVIIPFLVTFIADTLYLFVWTGFLENFFK
jgi:uncharacterized membrane protein (DUF485 family)